MMARDGDSTLLFVHSDEKICAFCGHEIFSDKAHFKGLPYHLTSDETGEPCEAQDSCLENAIALDKLHGEE